MKLNNSMTHEIAVANLCIKRLNLEKSILMEKLISLGGKIVEFPPLPSLQDLESEDETEDLKHIIPKPKKKKLKKQKAETGEDDKEPHHEKPTENS